MTAAEVAARAGVSRATVSYVLSGASEPSFSEATRARVRAAAADLGYVPNHAARALRTGLSRTVLLPLPGIYLSPVWAGIVDALARALARDGGTLVADFTDYDSTDAHVEAGLRLQPAVVIDSLNVSRDVVAAFEKHGTTVLRPIAPIAPSQEPSHRARLTQIDHLVAIGCRRIASIHLEDRDDDPRQGPAAEALMVDRCRSAGVELEIHRIDAGPHRSRAFATEVLDRPANRRIDGVCAVNDHVAAGVMTACLAAGLSVPGELAVVGIDDHPIAAALTPALTTVAWDFESFALDMASAVRRSLAGKPAKFDLQALDCTVVQRESA